MRRSPKRLYVYLLPSVFILLAILVICCSNSFTFTPSGLRLNPEAIERASGIAGTFNGETFKAILKRPGLETSINGVQVTPDLGLTAWVTLTGTQQHAVLLGDIPLREEEVNEVLRSMIDSGIIVTSLHNRFSMDSSRIMSLHFESLGTQEILSKAISGIWKDLSNSRIRVERPKVVSLNPAKSTLDEKTLESLLWKGKMANGVFQVSVGRGTSLDGQELGEATGVNSWAAFSGSNDYAVVNGDIATLEGELPDVLRELIEAKIQIVSIHTHLTQEKPKLIFVHFWGTGKLSSLAAGVKAAIWEKEHHQSQ